MKANCNFRLYIKWVQYRQYYSKIFNQQNYPFSQTLTLLSDLLLTVRKLCNHMHASFGISNWVACIEADFNSDLEWFQLNTETQPRQKPLVWLYHYLVLSPLGTWSTNQPSCRHCWTAWRRIVVLPQPSGPSIHVCNIIYITNDTIIMLTYIREIFFLFLQQLFLTH